ncbi:MAG TPA: serine hydrolase, partial [Stellaceae bacterium]|nr:serine hydrolase [Stellaceae bacterium]
MSERQEAATALPRAQPEKVGLSRERLQRLGDVLRGEVDSGRVPGAVVLVARHGKLAALEALGVRDPASGAAMRTSDIFRIYSMTKP